MDILNFISWIKGRRVFTTVDPNITLLPVGVTINFDPGVNNTITGVSYDATGTEFLITYLS